MNEMMLFNNPQFGEVRTVKEDGKVLFCGSDVAKALGYAKPQNAIDRHCKGALKRGIGVQTGIKADGTPAMQTVEMLFIPVGDIYRLAAKSELPGADEFESWIFDEVVPSVLKHGAYMTPATLEAAILNPDTIIKIATALKDEQDKRKALEVANSALTVDNAIMQPKADYFDELVDRNLLTNFRETAKELNVGPKAFVSFLLERKYVYRDKKGKLLPYQPYVDSGLFELKECFNEKTQWSGPQTLMTPKGRETFRLLFLAAKSEGAA